MNENPYLSPDDASNIPGRRIRWGRWILGSCAVPVGLLFLVALLFPFTRSAGPAMRSSHCKNQLKQIALALFNYQDEYASFPPAFTVDAEGNRLHSWRSLILPYLDEPQRRLYETIDFSKPWNDPANAAAFASECSVYRCAANKTRPGYTTYVAIVAENGCFRPSGTRTLSELLAPTSTLLVAEVAMDQAVHWMAPFDSDETTFVGLDGASDLAHANGVNVVMGDGSLRFMLIETTANQRRAMISISPDDNSGITRY